MHNKIEKASNMFYLYLGRQLWGPSTSKKSTIVYLWVSYHIQGQFFKFSVLWVSAFQTRFQQTPSKDNLAKGPTRASGRMGSGKKCGPNQHPDATRITSW